MSDIHLKGPNSPGISMTNAIYSQLQSIGCCKVCTLRFLGETNPEPYKNVQEALTKKGIQDVENGYKIVKNNPCTACLGFLQRPSSDECVDKIVEAINKADYDSNTFNIALSLPISFYIRAHAFWIFLMNNFPSHCVVNLPTGCIALSVKDAWKYTIISKIENRINKKFYVNSDFIVSVNITYGDDEIERACLLKMNTDVVGKQQKGKGKNKVETVSRKSIHEFLQRVDNTLFMQLYTTPPAVPTVSAVCGEIALQHSSIFIGGRYNKYSRTLSQTPWIINGERRMESSVQDIIAKPLQKMARAQSNKFLAAGREDVDVRMMGSGRPFALELFDPHKTKYSPEELKQIEKEIIESDNKIVAVRDLRPVTKESLKMLKEGEELKTKLYLAYCVAWNVSASKIHGLPAMAPFVLQQRTPVRVLHRRPVATRPKTIHWVKTSVVKTSGDAVYFKMWLKTQAGTYIKELVHGDFGRTVPSIGDLLGNATADILSLDVEEIVLNWPPVSEHKT